MLQPLFSAFDILQNVFSVNYLTNLTLILEGVERGEPTAAAELLPLVYQELRKLAQQKMASERAGHTLQPTALVHEAWLRLVGEQKPSWAGRAQFFSAAAEAMRRILVERARRKSRVRHGGALQRADFQDLNVASAEDDDAILAVNEAVERLAQIDATSAELIKLRFFGGLSNAEAARVLGLAERTAKRDWAYARAWLHNDLKRTL